MHSVSSNDLFSSFGWSALGDKSASLPRSQTVPVDVHRGDNASSLAEVEVSWDLVLDRTTLDVGFDVECLDGLDDTLLLSPLDAFTAECWDAAIQPPPKPLSKPRPKALVVQKSSVPFPRRRPAPLSIVPETSSDESGYESDSDDLITLKDVATTYASPLPSPFFSPLPSPYDTGFHLSHQPTVEPITLIKYSCLPYEMDASFVLFEPHHTINYFSEDNLGLSPFLTEQRKTTKVNRLAAFCSNLPNRLLRATS